ncbi:MAG: ATP-binding protein [Acidobacteriota bacterium]
MAQIDYWRQLPSETEVIEFKEAKSQYDNQKLFQYCVAIANEGGGHLILGIRNAPPRMVVGTKAIDNIQEMSKKCLDTLGFRVNIEEVAHPQGRVVVIIIPGRPKGHPYDLDGAFWMRCGESLESMTPDVLRTIVMEGESEWLLEPASERLGPAKILELLDVDLLFSMTKTPFPSTEEAVHRLVEEQFLLKERGGSFTITRFGAMLLAKQLSSFGDLRFKAPRVTVYRGASKLTDPTSDTFGTMGYLVNFPRVLRHIMARLPHREVITEGLRKSVPLVPEIVVRELVANALVHQDFTLSGSSISAEIFDDRIEISNPGETIVPVDRLINGMRSRNERLADFMRRVGICERRGSGIDRVVDAAESLHLPAPYFRATDQRTLSVAYGPRSFDEMDKSERVRACFQHCALKWETGARMTNQSLRERFKLPESKIHLVSQVIASALDAGAIKPDERAGTSKKFARYIPAWG